MTSPVNPIEDLEPSNSVNLSRLSRTSNHEGSFPLRTTLSKEELNKNALDSEIIAGTKEALNSILDLASLLNKEDETINPEANIGVRSNRLVQPQQNPLVPESGFISSAKDISISKIEGEKSAFSPEVEGNQIFSSIGAVAQSTEGWVQQAQLYSQQTQEAFQELLRASTDTEFKAALSKVIDLANKALQASINAGGDVRADQAAEAALAVKEQALQLDSNIKKIEKATDISQKTLGVLQTALVLSDIEKAIEEARVALTMAETAAIDSERHPLALSKLSVLQVTISQAEAIALAIENTLNYAKEAQQASQQAISAGSRESIEGFLSKTQTAENSAREEEKKTNGSLLAKAAVKQAEAATLAAQRALDTFNGNIDNPGSSVTESEGELGGSPAISKQIAALLSSSDTSESRVIILALRQMLEQFKADNPQISTETQAIMSQLGSLVSVLEEAAEGTTSQTISGDKLVSTLELLKEKLPEFISNAFRGSSAENKGELIITVLSVLYPVIGSAEAEIASLAELFSILKTPNFGGDAGFEKMFTIVKELSTSTPKLTGGIKTILEQVLEEFLNESVLTSSVVGGESKFQAIIKQQPLLAYAKDIKGVIAVLSVRERLSKMDLQGKLLSVIGQELVKGIKKQPLEDSSLLRTVRDVETEIASALADTKFRDSKLLREKKEQEFQLNMQFKQEFLINIASLLPFKS